MRGLLRFQELRIFALALLRHLPTLQVGVRGLAQYINSYSRFGYSNRCLRRDTNTTYTLCVGDIATSIVTVNTLYPIMATPTVSATQHLVAHGSGNTLPATVVCLTGIVSGISLCTAVLTYTYIMGCALSVVVTVRALVRTSAIATVSEGLYCIAKQCCNRGW
jgi:hypothetical protein